MQTEVQENHIVNGKSDLRLTKSHGAHDGKASVKMWVSFENKPHGAGLVIKKNVPV